MLKKNVMAPSITVPPPKVPKSRGRGKIIQLEQYAYTIHDASRRAFAVQIPRDRSTITESATITKTAIVSFASKNHAAYMVQLLESHKAINKEWPCTVFDDDFKLNFQTWGERRLLIGELDVMKWKFGDLKSYCVDNIMDMMFIKDIEENNKELCIKSDLIRLDMEPYFYASKFTEMFEQ